MPPPVIWALAADVAGMRAQAEGLAQQLARLGGGSCAYARASLPAAAKILPPALARFFVRIRPPADSAPPDIVIGCGVCGQAAALAMKSQAYAVYLQRPAGAAARFDAIVAPRHDYRSAPPPPNVICTLGSLGKITPESLAEQRAAARARFAHLPPPYVAALIGGENRAYQLDGDRLAAQLAQIAAAAGATLLVTLSRRSPPPLLPRLQRQFGGRHYVWDGGGENPYHDILAAADGYCVTADSVNMISEACAGGRAVYLLPLPAKSGRRAARAARKFAAFHDALIERGNIRFFSGEWEFFSAPPLDDTRQAAEELWRRCQNARAQGGRRDGF